MSAGRERVKVPVGPELCRHWLGIELRRLREAASLRLDDVAAVLEVAPSTVSRIETGKAPARATFVNAMLDMYRVDDPQARRRLAGMAREGWEKNWLSDFDDVLPAGALNYLGLESAASVVRSFAAFTVPDLAQTPGYAQALAGALYPPLSAAQAGKLAQVAMRRQELSCADAGRSVHLIADQSALLRQVGNQEVMTGQLDALAEMTADPSRTIQVAPLNWARTVVASSFTVLSFPWPDAPDVACRGEVRDTSGVTSRASEVTAMAGAFTALSQAALPPQESADLIRHLARSERDRS